MAGIFTKEAASIGIIGGADGPTAIYLAGRAWPALFAVGFSIVALLVWLLLRRK